MCTNVSNDDVLVKYFNLFGHLAVNLQSTNYLQLCSGPVTIRSRRKLARG